MSEDPSASDFGQRVIVEWPKSINALDGERLLQSTPVLHYREWWRRASGSLFLTNMRLVFARKRVAHGQPLIDRRFDEIEAIGEGGPWYLHLLPTIPFFSKWWVKIEGETHYFVTFPVVRASWLNELSTATDLPIENGRGT